MNNEDIPYKKDYNKLENYRKIYTLCLNGINLISITYLLIQNIKISEILDIILKSIYILLIISYFIVENYTEIFYYPSTAFNRRKGLIDNSLNSKFLDKEVKNYYSNDNINYGSYKLIVNCAENCFFTLNIAKKSRKKCLKKNFIIITLLIVCAVIGIRDNIIFIPILQIALSSQFIIEFFYLMNFISKLEHLSDEFIFFFENRDKRKEYVNQCAFLFFVNYETTLSYNKAPLDDNIYREDKDYLNNEWKELKKRYDI